MTDPQAGGGVDRTFFEEHHRATIEAAMVHDHNAEILDAAGAKKIYRVYGQRLTRR
jgi:hypothetical protein